jgi:hypothetical protein
MKLNGLLILMAAIWMIHPAQAQMYDPTYPVCMHVYGDRIGERIDCIFTSINQCRASASGLPASCDVNPYFHPENERHTRARVVR